MDEPVAAWLREITSSTSREIDRVREELTKHLTLVHDRLSDLTEAIDRQNGRVRRLEIVTGVLQWAIGLVGVVAATVMSAWVAQMWR